MRRSESQPIMQLVIQSVSQPVSSQSVSQSLTHSLTHSLSVQTGLSVLPSDQASTQVNKQVSKQADTSKQHATSPKPHLLTEDEDSHLTHRENIRVAGGQGVAGQGDGVRAGPHHTQLGVTPSGVRFINVYLCHGERDRQTDTDRQTDRQTAECTHPRTHAHTHTQHHTLK